VTIYRDASTGKFVSRRDSSNPKSSILVERYKAQRGDGTDHTGPRKNNYETQRIQRRFLYIFKSVSDLVIKFAFAGIGPHMDI